jgi:hypothetical protein
VMIEPEMTTTLSQCQMRMAAECMPLKTGVGVTGMACMSVRVEVMREFWRKNSPKICSNPDPPENHRISTNVPARISNPPAIVFPSSGSFSKMALSTIVKATDNLSIGATLLTGPVDNALK